MKKGFDLELEQEVEARFLAGWVGEDGSKGARVEARVDSKFSLQSQLLFTKQTFIDETKLADESF